MNPLAWFVLLLIWVFVAADLTERLRNKAVRIVLALSVVIFGVFCIWQAL